MLAKLELVKTNPFICEVDRLKDSLNDEFRAFVVFSYRVTYQLKSDYAIEILRSICF